MKKIIGFALLLAGFLVMLGCHRQENTTPTVTEELTRAEAVPAEEFVSIKDKQFFWRGQPYYVVGTNLWYGAYLGSPDEVGDRERLRKELDLLKQTGINNLRVLAASESSELVRA